MMDFDVIAGVVMSAARKVHTRLGAGLAVPVYATVLAAELRRQGLVVERHRSGAVDADGPPPTRVLHAQLLVHDLVLLELRSAGQTTTAHTDGLLASLRTLGLPLGMLINFGTANFPRGIHRILNHYHPAAAPAPG